MRMNNKKQVLIGTFVKKNRILTFLEFLSGKFKLKTENVFVYEISDNDAEYIVTFRATNKEYYLKNIKHSTVLHVKNGSLFSINALNKLIEIESGKSIGIDYTVDWSKYNNKLIILTNGELAVKDLFRIEDKSTLFK